MIEVESSDSSPTRPGLSTDMSHDQFRVKLEKRFRNVLVVEVGSLDSSPTRPGLSSDMPHDQFRVSNWGLLTGFVTYSPVAFDRCAT